jgi:hypothetical protein
MTLKTPPGSLVRRQPFKAVGITAATVIIAATSLVIFRGCASADGDGGSGRAARTPHVAIPKFGRPEEARRYFDAMIAGDRRSLALLEQAIREAEMTGDPNPAMLAELERDRALRQSRVVAYQAARAELK